MGEGADRGGRGEKLSEELGTDQCLSVRVAGILRLGDAMQKANRVPTLRMTLL